jgi:hypothetical protein
VTARDSGAVPHRRCDFRGRPKQIRVIARYGERREAMEDAAMRKLLFGLVPLAAVMVAVPAQSQVYVSPGAGVEVDVGRRHNDDDWRYRHRYDRSYDQCRVVRERIETPSGRVIYKTRREC